MSYANAITEFRQVMADTDLHKHSFQKKVLGRKDGDNTKFITFDKRVIEDTFTVQVDGVDVTFTMDDPVKGTFTVNEAPASNQELTASYYWQWWLDEEIKNFLNKGAESTGQFTDTIPDNSYLKIQAGLRSAAMLYGAYWATMSLIKYLEMRRHSSEYVIEEDGNRDANDAAMIDAMRREAADYITRADTARDDFWKRLGQRAKPSFGVKTVATRGYGPQR